jgi:hypothetical protein
MGYRLLVYPRLLKEISQTVSEVLGELAENASMMLKGFTDAWGYFASFHW